MLIFDSGPTTTFQGRDNRQQPATAVCSASSSDHTPNRQESTDQNTKQSELQCQGYFALMIQTAPYLIIIIIIIIIIVVVVVVVVVIVVIRYNNDDDDDDNNYNSNNNTI